MKKSFILSCLLFVSLSLFAFDFSIGGGVGSIVGQSYSTVSSTLDSDTVYSAYPVLEATPDFAVATNFDFGYFGFQLGFDFSYYYYITQTYSTSSKLFGVSGYLRSSTSEILSFVPYFCYHGSKFEILAGPLIGGFFYQYKYESASSSSTTTNQTEYTDSYFIYGAMFEFRYILGEHCLAYLSLPIFYKAGYIDSYELYYYTETMRFGSASLEFLPKIGIMYYFADSGKKSFVQNEE